MPKTFQCKVNIQTKIASSPTTTLVPAKHSRVAVTDHFRRKLVQNGMEAFKAACLSNR